MADTSSLQLADLTIIYVLDPPALTRDSIILLSSIRQVLGDVKVVAYTPRDKAEFLLPYVTEFYRQMDAEIRLMDPTDRFAPPYKQGNKILACLQPRETGYTLFLDTDTAVVAAFDRADLVAPGTVSVVPEGVQGWGGNPGSWEYVYAKFGLPFPEERVRLTRSAKTVPPYFNAGMIAFPTGSDFAGCWFRIAAELDADPEVRNKRPWLDQIALPLAIRQAGLQMQVMANGWNLSISHPGQHRHLERFFAHVDAIDARIVHYHQPKFFRGTRYQQIVDGALAGHTRFGSLADLTAEGDARHARREEVWQRFGELKKLRQRSPAEIEEMHALSREKNFIKSFRDSLERQIEIAPASIVKTAGEV
ncbi:hypothetical protein [Paracoccus marinaquae]|uniref:Uncharacterized protein n=1 Tax=Paracoccus marinaquae TaxID=2841926 RepID=A0ABS6AL40_9RHOB|nr:hypothetical protein [Paracoccus marinaquae]MBU3031278.1 hypothetical protein [Paracoccus marinaquae]